MLAFAIPVHTHISMNAVVTDYLPKIARGGAEGGAEGAEVWRGGRVARHTWTCGPAHGRGPSGPGLPLVSKVCSSRLSQRRSTWASIVVSRVGVLYVVPVGADGL